MGDVLFRYDGILPGEVVIAGEPVEYMAILDGNSWFEIPEIEIPTSVPFEIEYTCRSYGFKELKAVLGDGNTGNLQNFSIEGVIWNHDSSSPSMNFMKSSGTAGGWGESPLDGRSTINEKLTVKWTRYIDGKMGLYYDGALSSESANHQDSTFIINQFGWGTTNSVDRFVGELYNLRVSVSGVDVFDGIVGRNGMVDYVTGIKYITSGTGTTYMKVEPMYRAVLDGSNRMLELSTLFETADNNDWVVEIDCELTDPSQYALVYPIHGSGAELSELGLYLDYLNYSGRVYTSAGDTYAITNEFQSNVRDKRIALSYRRELPPTVPVVKLFLNNIEVGGIAYSGDINLDSLMSYLPGYFYSCHMVNNTTGQEINIETTKTGFKDTISGTEYPALPGTIIEEAA